MKKYLSIILAVAACFLATPHQAKAQGLGDVFLLQRTGTANVALPAAPAGTSYVLFESGSATLSSGSATITNTAANPAAIFGFTGVGTTAAGTLTVGPIVSGTSFKIISTSGSDARVVYWWFVQ